SKYRGSDKLVKNGRMRWGELALRLTEPSALDAILAYDLVILSLPRSPMPKRVTNAAFRSGKPSTVGEPLCHQEHPLPRRCLPMHRRIASSISQEGKQILSSSSCRPQPAVARL